MARDLRGNIVDNQVNGQHLLPFTPVEMRILDNLERTFLHQTISMKKDVVNGRQALVSRKTFGEKVLAAYVEGSCIVLGTARPNSPNLRAFSSSSFGQFEEIARGTNCTIAALCLEEIAAGAER